VNNLRRIWQGNRTTAARRRCLPADEPRSPRCRNIATPAPRYRSAIPLPLTTSPPAASLLIRHLYERLVELEALAVTADEAVTMLPAGPTGRYRRTLARLYALAGRTAGQASATLGLGEELVKLAPRSGWVRS
jgi:hypothetical protein